MKSHKSRLEWLSENGFYAGDRSFEHSELGLCVLVIGKRAGIEESMWLSARDGMALIHQENSPAKSFAELQDWVLCKDGNAKKVLPGQRNLFGDDE